MGRNYFDWETMEWYDSYEEARPAKQRYKQQKLLEEQNKILEKNAQKEVEYRKQQMELQRKTIEEQRLNDEMNRAHEDELEEKRQSHDKELEEKKHTRNKEDRLLELCDKIGISKTLIDNFEESLLFSVEQSKLSKNVNNINKKIEDLDYMCDDLWDTYRDLSIEIARDKYGENITIKAKLSIETYNNIKNNQPYEYPPYDEELELLLKKKYKIYSANTGFGLIIAFSSFAFLGIFCDLILLGIMGLIGLICGIYGIKYKLKQLNEIKEKIIIRCDEKIKEQTKILKERKQIEKSYEEIKIKKDKNLDEVMKYSNKKEKLEKELVKIEKENIKNNLNDFYQFRINHYNKEIEKLLLDFEFNKKYKNNFVMIDKKESRKSGTIDDYIEYFLSKIKEYKKYKSD